MPTQINGIGTAYFGKSNRQAFDGTCEHCHRRVKLANYETRLWFTVIFIPVIPLGRRQILSYCESCTWHRAVPLAQWQKITQEAVGESAQKWDENRDDPDAAIEMHSTLVAFNKRAEADRLAELLLQKFDHVSKVQFYVGGWYERTGRGADADACFARALELDPASLPAKRAVALGKIEQGRLGEARALLADFEPPQPAFEPALFFLLAQGHQKQEQHQEALNLFEMVLRARPSIAGEKDFRQAVRVSEKALGAQTSLVPVDRFYNSTFFRWAVAAALALAGLVAWNYYIQTHRLVHVVNGLGTPISVQVDGGSPISVAPHGRTELRLAEGIHKAALVQPAGAAAPVDFSIESGWFARFFRTPVHVLDPSRSAAVVWEQVVYRAVQMPGGDDGRHEWHVGQAHTAYPDVDYQFEEFPQQLQVKHQNELTKSRVTTIDADPLVVVAMIIGERGMNADLLDFCESHLRNDPAAKPLLKIYYTLGAKAQKVDRCRAFLASRLDDRPPLIEWHRMYQEATEVLGKQEELLGQYDGYLAAAPGDSALLYLRGRIEPDEARTRDFLERARAADPKNPYPWFALGYHLLAAGEFAEAKAALEEAHKLDPADDTFEHLLTEARFAAGDFDELAKEAQSKLAAAPFNLSAQQQLLEALVAGGHNDQAERAQETFANAAQAQAQDQLQLGLTSRIGLLYLIGDFQELLTAAAPLRESQFSVPARIQALIELGRVAEAGAANATRDGRVGHYELVASLAWAQKGNEEQAKAALERAVAALAAGQTEERRCAELLKQGRDLPEGTAQKLVWDPSSKALVLTALARTCPQQKEALLSLAEKLNYRRQFPYHFLKRAIAELRQ